MASKSARMEQEISIKCADRKTDGICSDKVACRVIDARKEYRSKKGAGAG